MKLIESTTCKVIGADLYDEDIFIIQLDNDVRNRTNTSRRNFIVNPFGFVEPTVGDEITVEFWHHLPGDTERVSDDYHRFLTEGYHYVVK